MQMLFVRTSAIPIGDKPAADGLRGVIGPHVVVGGHVCAGRGHGHAAIGGLVRLQALEGANLHNEMQTPFDHSNLLQFRLGASLSQMDFKVSTEPL